LISKLSNILNDINTVLLPSLCFGCNARLYRGENLLCTLCRNQLPLTEYNFNEENAVDRIFYGRIPVEKAASFLFYSEKGVVKNLIHYLKYRNQPQLGTFLGQWWGEQLSENGLGEKIDCVVPVPLHPSKQRRRGYNQVTLFAVNLADRLQVPYLETALVKTANSKTQTRKDRWFRWQSSKELYQLSNPILVEFKRVLLVDDVITTGATLEACSRALLKAEGTTVYIATMAVVP
jgi:ComF family protein